ncbi:MAG TPA: S1 RNA-binding domain-containing protein [Rhizomicrobium sp.]|nr:S1 RNA-binding domain-containing protein [Rhizomicrobium sp.]
MTELNPHGHPYALPSLDALKSESDVEQKLIAPLLVAPEPYGLAFGSSHIHTKANIRRFIIGKGKEQKSYFPDYLIVLAGIPLQVWEAKSPNEDIEPGFREARLYAAELNAQFQSGLNPLRQVVATNGHEIWAGYFDQAEPVLKITAEEYGVYSPKMAQFMADFGARSLDKEFHSVAPKIRPARLFKPRRLLGGLSTQNEEIGHNTFGATISADFSAVFNPVSRRDRARIAKEGYIRSRRRERYVAPIDRVVRTSTPSLSNAALIEDTGNPTEVVSALKKGRPLEHQVLLIIGGVGSGKTTFIDYLQEVALPKDVRENTVWVHLNMNTAPVSPTEIYDWLRDGITDGCRAAFPSIDFDLLKTMEAVYSTEVNKFNKGIGSLYPRGSDRYRDGLADALKGLEADRHKRAVAHSRYCSTERGKLLILILDNCDKRSLDEQLLMFEAAQWVQREFRALVVLPLREETYDNYRDKPPLDTALKDLVFRIEAPLFYNVLVSRVQLAMNDIGTIQPKTYRYELPNGFHVEYASADQAHYLASIIRSIFEHDRHVRSLLVGLAGRNIRRALEIFLEFCSSGHIGEDQITRITQSHGQHILPLFLVLRVLLRMNRRFYDSDHSYVKNLFSIEKNDDRPMYFARLMVLRWLQERSTVGGPSGVKGYFRLSDLARDLEVFGIESKVTAREVEYLVKANCIMSEALKTEALTDDDLIRVSSAGLVHLELLDSVDYFAAISEDTWFEDEATARNVADRIAKIQTHYIVSTTTQNAKDLIGFLDTVRTREIEAAEVLLASSAFPQLTDLAEAKAALEKLESATSKPTSGPWARVITKYPVGKESEGVVTSARHYGVMVELEPGLWGLVHKSRLPDGYMSDDRFSPGEKVRVKTIRLEPTQKKIEFDLVAFLNDE